MWRYSGRRSAHRLPARIPLIDFDVTTSEEIDDYQEANNAENIDDDEQFVGENNIHYNEDEEGVDENDPPEAYNDVMVPNFQRNFHHGF